MLLILNVLYNIVLNYLSIIRLLGHAFLADTFIVELLLINQVAVNEFWTPQQRSLLIEEIIDLSAFLAEEMDMWRDVAIIAYTMIIDGDHLSYLLLSKETQRIINSCAAERGDLGDEGLIDILYRGMGGMSQQILHNGEALNGWAQPDSLKALNSFVTFHSFPGLIL